MKITRRTITFLEEFITGNSKISPYQSGPELIEFFEDFGVNDIYGQGFPSRHIYVRNKLQDFNGTETIDHIIQAAFDFYDSQDYNPEHAVEKFNPILFRDGYQLVKQYRRTWMNGDKVERSDPFFEVRSVTSGVVETYELAQVGHEAVKEQIRKAKEKSEKGDHSGAIANCYTLTEHMLKLMLEEQEIPFKETEGDIRSLYKLLKGPLNLDAGVSGINQTLKPILTGLQQLVSGLFEMANKASDRHARVFNPSAHHAQLAVNATFTLAEFLVATRDYQLKIGTDND